MPTKDELQRIVDERNRALNEFRATEDEGTKQNAWGAVEDLRTKMDEGVVDMAGRLDALEAEREQMVEQARAQASSLHTIAIPQSPVPVADLRKYGQSKARGETISFVVPFAPVQAADWTTTDTTTYTSYTVPQTWANQVYMKQIAMSGVLAAGPTILRTANGNQFNQPTLTTDMTAQAGTEGSAATETNPVHGTVALNSYRVDGWTPVADEVFRDSGVDIEAHIRKLAARALATKAAPYYADIDVGTGSSLPSAITVGITNGKTCASQTAVTLTEAKALLYSLLPQYRQNAKFVGNSTVTVDFATMKDANGNFQWNTSVAAGEPDTLFGKPYFEDSFMDASTTGNIPLICGDVEEAYIVRFIGGIEVSISRDFAFTSFESTARFALYHDAALIDNIACKAATLA